MVRKIVILICLVVAGAGFSMGSAWLLEPSNPECILSTPHGQMLDWVLTEPDHQTREAHQETEPCVPRLAELGPSEQDIGYHFLATLGFYALFILIAQYIAIRN